MGGRLYVGKIPRDVRERDVDKTFRKFGRIREIAMKGNYCFIVCNFLPSNLLKPCFCIKYVLQFPT